MSFLSLDKNEPYARHVTPFKGWPEYVNKVSGNRDVILLSNSQALGGEYKDSKLIYAAQLQQDFKNVDDSLQLYNRAKSDLNAFELELLSAHSLAQSPELLIINVSLKNFDPIINAKRQIDQTDISLLLFNKDVFTSGIQAFSQLGMPLHALIKPVITKLSYLYRTRHDLLRFLSQNQRLDIPRLLMGNYRRQNDLRSIDIRETSLFPAQESFPELKDIKALRMYYEKNNQLNLNQFYSRLQQHLSERKTQLLWVWMPLVENEKTNAFIESTTAIQTTFCDRLIMQGHQCVDLSLSLDNSHFYNTHSASHLNKQGHQVFAKKLKPLVLDVLY